MTLAGYRERKAARIAALKRISKEGGVVFGGDDGWKQGSEDGGKGKGKGRLGTGGGSAASGEIEEVVKILRSIVQRWAAGRSKAGLPKSKATGKSRVVHRQPSPTMRSWDVAESDPSEEDVREVYVLDDAAEVSGWGDVPGGDDKWS